MDISDIRSETDRLLMASLAPNTRHAYDSGIRAYSEFRLSLGLIVSWPPSVKDFTDFISYLSLKGASPSTARSYVSGIGFKCKVEGVPDITQNFLVKKLLLGMSKLGIVRDRRLPITIDLLKNIARVLPAVCSSNYEATLFSAIFSMAYFGLFRVGELVVNSSSNLNHAVDILNVRMQEHDNVLEVLLSHSKTDQKGKGTVIALPAVNTPVCPVVSMKAYMSLRPEQSGPLFIHFSGTPVSRFQFASVLKKALHFLNVQNDCYKSHSFRIGAASCAASKGLSEDRLKQLGRWESKAYKSYVRIPTGELL